MVLFNFTLKQNSVGETKPETKLLMWRQSVKSLSPINVSEIKHDIQTEKEEETSQL